MLHPLHLDLPEQEARRGGLRAPHLLDKQGRVVMGFAVDRKRKASSRVEPVCSPCKRWQRERRHYRHA